MKLLFGRFYFWPKPHISIWGWRDKHGDYRHSLDLGRLTYYPGGRK